MCNYFWCTATCYVLCYECFQNYMYYIFNVSKRVLDCIFLSQSHSPKSNIAHSVALNKFDNLHIRSRKNWKTCCVCLVYVPHFRKPEKFRGRHCCYLKWWMRSTSIIVVLPNSDWASTIKNTLPINTNVAVTTNFNNVRSMSYNTDFASERRKMIPRKKSGLWRSVVDLLRLWLSIT